MADRQTPSQLPSRSTGERWLRRALLIGALVGGGWWTVATAIGTPPPVGHPAERAARQLGKKVNERVVVRADGGGLDVWLFSDAPFDRLLGRARFVMGNGVELRGGYRLEGVQESEHDGSAQARLSGPSPADIWLGSHLSGSLIIIRGVGNAAEAPPWAPPYRPLPLELPHGPVR